METTVTGSAAPLVEERWGIIYSPKSGILHSHRRWEKIRVYLNAKGIEYDFVQSENHTSEGRLAAMLAKNGYKTIIIVGGDGALNRAINGIFFMDPELCRTITFGIIPNGYGNDYAHFWGLSEDDITKSIDVLIKKRIRSVDVGILREGGKEHCFLNCINIGLAASIMNIRHKTYRFWGLSSLSYLSSMFILLFHRMEHRIKFIVNREVINRSLMNVCIGNAHAYGLTPNAVPYNGMLDVTTLSHPAISQLIAGMYMLTTGKILTHRNAHPYRSRQKIVFEEIGHSHISLDGQSLSEIQLPFEVSVRQEWINFIIP